VNSTPGEGSKFTISLPVGAALGNGQTATPGTQEFAG